MGSCFAVTLPIHRPEENSRSDVAALQRNPTCDDSASPTAATFEPIQFEGRVLLVEDGIDNQRLIAFILRRAGIDVVLAENGKIACDLVWHPTCQQPFDLILMDMQMPVMNGYEATRALRESGYGGAIVALTAHALPEDSEKCLQAGCDEYATKPIDRPAFFGMLARHLAVPAEAGTQVPPGID